VSLFARFAVPGRRRRTAARIGLLITLAVALLPAQGTAHPLAPALLEVVESAPGRAEVHWKTSRLRPRGMEISPLLPSHCRETGEERALEDPTSFTLVFEIDCGEPGLIGQPIAIQGIESASIDVLVRLALADGRVVNEILTSRRPTFVVPARPSSLHVFESYLEMGTAHILGGFDHLAFLVGLMILAVGARLLIETITAFTLGHSITLSLVALGFARVPSRLIELLIAVSVLVLAVEVARPPGPQPHLLRRRPWLMAAGFGLLHGMGFAGALAEVGLPQTEIPLALFAFNVGIEIGQISFVLAMIGIRALLRPLIVRLPAWVSHAPAYAIGSLAVYWCLERAGGLL
jgi:hydrogenase/urease accessory protein HupE